MIAQLCTHCGRERKAHGKTTGRCPSPSGKTWHTFTTIEDLEPSFTITTIQEEDHDHPGHQQSL